MIEREIERKIETPSEIHSNDGNTKGLHEKVYTKKVLH